MGIHLLIKTNLNRCNAFGIGIKCLEEIVVHVKQKITGTKRVLCQNVLLKVSSKVEERISFFKREAEQWKWNEYIYIYFFSFLSHTQILKSLYNQLDSFRKVTSRKSNFCLFKDHERKWKSLVRWDWL